MRVAGWMWGSLFVAAGFCAGYGIGSWLWDPSVW